eukprot:TRINITY_DN4742_c0_g2_i2.p1 TRINITY_DN4742_c0_g2~~TRINITY_DN4742_c0_g2_i2.p1  ORF type:complete len:618 (-),score=74.57 TRINITY_DN4742_c0_g2_i2:416-2269(-)
MLKSALTAALSTGEQGDDSTKQDPKIGVDVSSVDDPQSFPCLFQDVIQGDAGDETDDSSEEQALFLEQAKIPREEFGSFTGTDYPLHPQKRRGGTEVDPGTFGEIGLGSIPEYYGKLRSNYLTQEILGSLPKGLSQQQRDEILSSVPLSPSLQMVQDMGPSNLNERSKKGKIARRSILKGSVLVFITAGQSGKKFIYQRVKQLGVRCIVIDGPDSWSQHLAKDNIIDKFIPLNMTDVDTLFERCLKAIKKVQSDYGQLDGVLTFCELAIPLVSRVAEYFGLPCNSPESVDRARNKFETRGAMEQAGLPCPKHFLIKSKDDLKKAQEKVSFPAVIKPIFGAASIGVVRVGTPDELQKAYDDVIQVLSRAVVVAGALEEGKTGPQPSQPEANAQRWIDLSVMMEEYLDGAEIDCDLVFSNGECVYGSITDNWPTIEPFFNETGSNCPSILPLNQQKELMQLSVGAVKAMGLRIGVFHVECKYTSRGPRLIEINCRMGGGPVRDTNLLVWGVDLVEEQIYASLGIPSQPIVARRPRLCIAEYSINAAKTGKLLHDRFLEEYKDAEGVIYARPLAGAGQNVVSVEDGLPTWVAELMVYKPSVQDAINYVTKIVQEIDVPIE